MEAKYELALQEKLVAAEQRYHKLYEEKLEIEVLKGRRDLELQLDAARTRAEKAEDVVTFHAQRAAQEKTLSDARARQWSDERAKLTRDAEASYDSLYKEVSTNANDVVEKLQAQLRAAQAAAEEARAGAKRRELDLRRETDAARTADTRQLQEKYEALVKQYQDIADQVIAKAKADREKRQREALARLAREEADRRAFEARVNEATRKLVDAAKREAREERQKFAALERQVRHRFAEHCRAFEERMRARAVELLTGGGAEAATAASFPSSAGDVPDLAFLGGGGGGGGGDAGRAEAGGGGGGGGGGGSPLANGGAGYPSEAELSRYRSWSQGHIPRDRKHEKFGESPFEQISRLHNARTHERLVRDRAAALEEERQARARAQVRRSGEAQRRKADESARVHGVIDGQRAFGHLKGAPRFQPYLPDK